MQPQFPVRILAKKLIKSAAPTPHSLQILKISSLDQYRPGVYVPYIFFYPANDKAGAAKNEERCKQLHISLSEVLVLFYPLAGRYIEEKLLIDCNDNGAEFIEAKVDTQLVQVLNMDLDNEQLHQLVPHYSESSMSPLVAVQCNMFECGGLVIGICISHRIVDAFVYNKFIDGWAITSRVGIDKVEYRPSFGLGSLFPAREMMRKVKHVTSGNSDLKIVSKIFIFSDLAISNLRMMAKRKLACRPSRVQLVIALIWKALIGVEQAKHGQLRPSLIIHVINMRGRTVLPISDDCCGNLLRPVLVRFTPEKCSNKVGIHELVSLVSEAIANAVTYCAKPRNGEEFLMMVDKAWREAADEFNRDAGVQSYFFTSTCGMPFYPDFGWGKPTRVIRLKGRFNILTLLMDTRDGDGVVAWIRLVESDMNLFQQDPDIIAFTSQVDQHHDDHSTYLRSRY